MPVYLAAFARRGDAYLAVRNRAERLTSGPDGKGLRCEWQWTSELHAPKIFPALGRHLMRLALAQHPVKQDAEPPSATGDRPQVSFLIGHRGVSRLPHLLATLKSIAAQTGATVECIVVEQESAGQLGPRLPGWVRLIQTPPPTQDMPYCRSWAFNVGARSARADVLVLHDNDMMVPADYAAQIVARVALGYQVLNLKRFVFYLTKAHSEAFFAHTADLPDASPAAIVQNLEAGGSVAITRAGFDLIGGMDESFVGWGGEDNEFWERAQTLRAWTWGFLPLIHLWHAAQPGKRQADYPTAKLYRQVGLIHAQERIQRLRRARQGELQGPCGWSPGAGAES
jgi:hypothetical protein